MTSLMAHSLRLITRRAAWPLAIAIHLASATLFVAAWGPTAGLPLWSASMLTQFVAADLFFLAVLVTWLAAALLAPGADADICGWSSVTGQPIGRVVLSRALAAVVLAAVMVVAVVPVAVAAAQISASTPVDLTSAILEMAAFAVLSVGMTAAASVALRHQLAVWSASMALAGIAAVGDRQLPPGIVRLAVLVIVGIAGIAAAAAAADQRWLWAAELEP